MREALEAGETGKALSLMSERAQAMTFLEDAHRAADSADVEACRQLLVNMQQEDRELQELAADSLQEVDQACRSDLGGAPTGQSSYRDEPALACLDRRA